ncbi:MAG TPA: pyridoxamine 5'-phosphate oxidase family protein [Amycolatopsis sp.]|uniref:pyridoxamine 5'-phosphate oxidase family protein n=1 Tax=Amycolatopsis sp. TaxID=37632 RepID=UPI002B459FEA|nr:pyridoxamine 5'-phosphate oxidase family protein [Amycolatopsis sp.]HKS49197.1 pyridoxamine 5'-phosphate oxidase family protein [Amycolatopsis sp.]
MTLSVRDRERFLAEPHIGALAVAWTSDRAPLTVPTWYRYTPGGELWIHTGPDSREARAIRAAGRFSLMVQRTEPTVRDVSVAGPVTRVAPGGPERSWEMAARDLPPDRAADFVEYERIQLGEHVGIRMRPDNWLSADLGSF